MTVCTHGASYRPPLLKDSISYAHLELLFFKHLHGGSLQDALKCMNPAEIVWIIEAGYRDSLMMGGMSRNCMLVTVTRCLTPLPPIWQE